jgi:hypothetical protein
MFFIGFTLKVSQGVMVFIMPDRAGKNRLSYFTAAICNKNEFWGLAAANFERVVAVKSPLVRLLLQ